MQKKHLLLIVFLVQLLLISGCEPQKPVNNEVRSGSSLLVEVDDTSGASMLDMSALTAELILDNDASSTVFKPKIVRIFRTFPDPLSTAGRNYALQSSSPPPVNDGRWMSIVHFIDSLTDQPLDFSSITLPSAATLTIKENNIQTSVADLKILAGQATPNPWWDGTSNGLGQRLLPNPHVLIKVTGVAGNNFAGAKFVVQYNSSIWTNGNDDVLKKTNQSMIKVTKAVPDPYIHLSVNEIWLDETHNEITILFGNSRGFQPFQRSEANNQGYYFLEDGKSYERDASTVVLSWFLALGLTAQNFASNMSLTHEIFDINGDIIQGAGADFELRF